MGWLSDLHKGNKHWFSEQWKAIKDDPERLLLGAMTPVGSKLWGGITGEDYKPVMDVWGGPSADVYASGEAKGLNMGPAHDSHRIARAVAAMGMAGGGSAPSGAEAAPNMGATNPALIDSAMGTPGYGASSAGAGGGAGAAGGFNWQDMVRNQVQGGGGGRQQSDLDRQRKQAMILQQMQQHELQQQANQKVPGWTI